MTTPRPPRTRLLAIVALAAVALAAAAFWAWRGSASPRPVTPDPWGTIEQVMASIPADQAAAFRRTPTSATSELSLRASAARGRYTGDPRQVEFLLVELERLRIDAQGEITADGLGAIDARNVAMIALVELQRAWRAAGPFEGVQARAARGALALLRQRHHDVHTAAGLVLMIIAHKPGTAAAELEALIGPTVARLREDPDRVRWFEMLDRPETIQPLSPEQMERARVRREAWYDGGWAQEPASGSGR